MEAFLFGLVSLMAIIFAAGMVVSRNAVHSALCLIGNFGCVAFLYLMLDAPFLAMVQIAVYAGAIMVLFLFVIMLLGTEDVEQSHDTTTRRFTSLSTIVGFLCLVLMGVLAYPVIRNNFTLPEAPGKAPLVRIVQAAAAPEITVDVTGPGLAEPWHIDRLEFGGSTEFKSLPAGDYTLTLVGLVNPSNGSTIDIPQPVTLSPDEVVTLVIGGEINPEAGRLIQVYPVQNDLTEVNDGSGRVVLFNGYSPDALMLVDLGPDEVLSTDTRDSNLVVIDPVIAENITYLGEPVVGKYHAGDYTLAFVKPVLDADGKVADYTVLEPTIKQKIVADTENTVLLVKDGEQAVAGSLLGDVRSTVVSGLTIDTLPTFGSPLSIGRILFTVYLLPVNIVGLLLLVALVGVIVISRPSTEKKERRSNNLRRRVSRPLVNVISQQTGNDVAVETPRLGPGSEE